MVADSFGDLAQDGPMQGDLVAHSALQHGGGEHRGLLVGRHTTRFRWETLILGCQDFMMGSQQDLMNEISGWQCGCSLLHLDIQMYVNICQANSTTTKYKHDCIHA